MNEQLKKLFDQRQAEYDKSKAAMKWICDDCDDEFAEPLYPDFGPDEGMVCPNCYSKNIHEKNKK